MDSLIITNLLDSIKARLVATSSVGITIDYNLRKDISSISADRFINIYLLQAGKTGPASRLEDNFDVKVAVVFGMRYTDRATPPREWIEQRITDELKNVYHILTSPRSDFFAGGFWPQADDFSSIVSHEMLEEKKLFWGEMEITFRTIIADDLIQTSF